MTGGRRPSKRVAIIAATVIVLLIAAGGGAFALKQSNDRKEAEAAAAAADRQREREVEAKEASDQAERDERADMVTQLQDAIEKDAKKSVKDDLLEGPIKLVQCTATGGGSVDDLTALTGTFECLAANKENDDGTIEGYRYSGTIDWDAGQLQWRLGG